MRAVNWAEGLVARALRPGRGAIALLLALALARGAIYAAIIPPWQAPDEPYHVLAAHATSIRGTPDAAAQWAQLQSEMTASLVQYHWWDFVVFVPAARSWQEIRGHLPNGLGSPRLVTPRAPTYRILSLALQPVQHQDIAFQLYWARLLSVLTNLGVVGVAFAVGRLLFGNESFGAWLLPLTVVFLPTNTFVTATVNDGNPAELLVSVAILFLVLAIVRGLRWQYLLAVGIFTFLGVLAKPTAYFFVPVFVLALMWWVWRRLEGWWKLASFPPFVLWVAASLAISTRLQKLAQSILNALTGAQSAQFLVDLRTLPFERDLLWVVGHFWADLGWHSLGVDDTWAFVLSALAVLAVVGLGKLAWRSQRRADGGRSERALRRSASVFALCVFINMVFLAISSARTGISYFTARYMLGAVLPAVGLLVIGWRELVPSGWRREGLVLMAVFLFLFDAVVLWCYAVPFFYPLWR